MRQEIRDFLKVAAVAVTGLALASSNHARAEWPANGTMEINPGISNLRVVALKDTAMITGTPTSMTFENVNAVINKARVHANMDAMAMQLANKGTADEAWKAIFRSSKAWASTIVAIKVNNSEAKNTARLAVLEKFSTTFVGFGVPPKNIIIYDGCVSAEPFKSHFSATDTSKIPGVVSSRNDALGGSKSAPLAGGSSASCTADIASGKVDILINIGNNKGHTLFGGAALCMKNHLGTFAPTHNDINNYTFNANKSDAIVGGTPVRQQLCFIDSLFANKKSNTGAPDVMPAYLIMGTFAPAVDYLTIKKVREEVMSCTHTANVVNSYLTSFGYTTADPVWIVVPPAGEAPAGGAPDGGPGGAGGGAGGKTGSGGARAGGAPGAGGAQPGGANDSGGARTGGAPEAGAQAGGANGAGGAGSGGAQGAGGGQTGGSTEVGGNAGGKGMGEGGATLTTASSPADISKDDGGGSNSRCGLGGGGAGSFAVVLVLGAFLARQLRRLLLRRESLAARPKSQTDKVPSMSTDKDAPH